MIVQGQVVLAVGPPLLSIDPRPRQTLALTSPRLMRLSSLRSIFTAPLQAVARAVPLVVVVLGR